MRSFLSAILCGLLMTALTALGLGLYWHDTQIADVRQLAMDRPQATATASPEARVIDLPEDGQQYHFSVCVHDDWPARPLERDLVAWVNTDQALQGVWQRTHHHFYVASDPMFRKNLLPALPALPAVLIQPGQDGAKPIYCTYAGSKDSPFPESADVLGEKVALAFSSQPQQFPNGDTDCFRRNRRQNKQADVKVDTPPPDPNTLPKIDTDVQVAPPAKVEPPIGLALAIIGAVFVATVLIASTVGFVARAKGKQL